MGQFKNKQTKKKLLRILDGWVYNRGIGEKEWQAYNQIREIVNEYFILETENFEAKVRLYEQGLFDAKMNQLQEQQTITKEWVDDKVNDLFVFCKHSQDETNFYVYGRCMNIIQKILDDLDVKVIEEWE